MNKKTFLGTLASVGVAVALAPAAGNACGEGQFNMGKGLRYQAYLAPRPATVLVYETEGTGSFPGRHVALVNALRASGHKVTQVGDDAALAAALQGQRFDVVIAAYDNIDQVAASAASSGAAAPSLLPVVARKMRNAPEVRSRFAAFVLDGASLGQYLRGINSVLPAAAP